MIKKRLVSIMILNFCLLTGCGSESEFDTIENTVPAAIQEIETESETLPETTETESEPETLPETTETESESETLPETTETEAESEPETLPETTEAEKEVYPDLPEIFFISQDGLVNWYGFRNDTLVADMSGAVYHINNTPDYRQENFFDVIRLSQLSMEPMMQLDAETVQNFCTLGESIDPETEFDGEHGMLADAGTVNVLFCHPETNEMTTCYWEGSGASHHRMDDAAQEFMNLYHETIQMTPEASSEFCTIYTPLDTPILSIQAESEISGNYFIKDEEELKQFAEKCNVPLDDILIYCKNLINSSEEYVYFVELNASRAIGMLHFADESVEEWEFLHTQKKSSDYCNIIAYSTGDARFEVREKMAQEVQISPDGTEWKHISD